MTNHPIFTDKDPQKETITLNLGPTHPATHGVFQNILEMDGERIVSGVSTIGYIHRAFEKIAEHRPFYQIYHHYLHMHLQLLPNAALPSEDKPALKQVPFSWLWYPSPSVDLPGVVKNLAFLIQNEQNHSVNPW